MRPSHLLAVALLALAPVAARAQGLTVALASTPSAIDPHFHNLVPNNAIAAHVFDKLVHQPHGIVLVTGPTGSGKTTTLYASLGRIDTAGTNILTVEDPVEYELPGIGQTQVNAKIDLTFGKALRAILRQDPDVIMIGEIRDFETAQIAIQASLTGHLVLATLHTNDAASAVTRLTDMGVEPFLLSSSLLGVLAQRLVRKYCGSCHGKGCEACGHTGYAGRTGVFELLVTNDAIRAQIHNRTSEADIRSAALASGSSYTTTQLSGPRSCTLSPNRSGTLTARPL